MKNQTLPILIGAFFAMMLFSCGTTKEIQEGESAKAVEIPFNPIGKGALFGGGQEGFDEGKATMFVLRSMEEWEKFKAQMNSVNTVTGAFEDSDLDFESEMIVACIDRVRGSGGHEIKIESIFENSTELHVNVLHLGPGDMAASVLTQPFAIVRVAKSGKNVILNFQEK